MRFPLSEERADQTLVDEAIAASLDLGFPVPLASTGVVVDARGQNAL
jgi:hypothetical protein